MHRQPDDDALAKGLLDVYDQPTGVQDVTYPDEPDYSDLENERIRDKAADAMLAVYPGGFRSAMDGEEEDGDPGDEGEDA